CRPVRALPGGLDASRDGPGTRQQGDGVEDPDTEIQVRLGLQVELAVLRAGDQVDREIPGEEKRLEEHEHPHVRLPPDEPRRLVLKRLRPGVGEVCHETAPTESERSPTRLLGRSGNGPVPKSSRSIILRSSTMKTPV